jgi:hypothetical protein
VRRALIGGLSKLIGVASEVDHQHYLRARFLKQHLVATLPPILIIYHGKLK